MYTLRGFLTSVLGMSSGEIASEELYCSESNTQLTFLTNTMQDTLAAYSYTLVREGWLKLNYNGSELTLHPGDLLIYSPGFPISIISGSDDYHAVCLIVDEQSVLEMPGVSNVLCTAYQPIAELGQPIVRLRAVQATHFWQHMQEIIRYQHSSHHYLQESLRTLYTQFALDLMDVMEQVPGYRHVSERTTEIFATFMRLLATHFKEHHDISFYAGELNITATHLSRIVRQMTGRSVVAYINQMLFMESAWLLQSTGLSISDIADRLHFSDQSSFARFFTRIKGVSPKIYRYQRQRCE